MTMPTMISPPDNASYKGINKPFIEFVNEDGKLSKWNCGQAAAASLIKYLKPENETEMLMALLELHFRPNNPFGMGTSPRQIRRMLKAYEIETIIVRGKEEMQANIPCILTYQFELTKFLGISIPTAHWMMVYGYDDDYIYLTNWWDNRMSWSDFLSGWNGWALDLQDIRNSAIAVKRN